MSDQKTFSAAPFISYDGPDETGLRAEVRVVLGYGNVIDIEESGNGNSKNIIFKVENTKYKLNGWAPSEEEAIIKIAEDALENREPIHFRIETKRQNKVDRSLPMSVIAPPRDSEKARENTFKSLAALKREDDEEWTISSKALTRLDEDPKSGAANSAYSHSLEDLQAAKQNNSKDARGGNASTGAKTGGFHSVESTPWFSRNNDGSINFGSTAVGIPMTVYVFITNYAKENNITISEKHTALLTKAIINSANKIQVEMYEDEEKRIEEPDLSLGSHTRARSAIFDVIKLFIPITEEIFENKEALAEWKKSVEDKALGMWKWSVSVVEDYI